MPAINSTLKYPVIVTLAIALSFSLIFLMQLLISIDSVGLGEHPDRKITDIYMPEHKLELIKRVEKPERPEILASTPPPFSLQPQALETPDPAVIEFAPVDIGMNMDFAGLALNASDGEYLPIIRVAPVYPINALRSGIEGYVIVEFTVTKSGTVKDVRIVEAKPNHVFNRVAREAVSHFQYRPKIVDGEPVEVTGIKNKFTFKISR